MQTFPPDSHGDGPPVRRLHQFAGNVAGMAATNTSAYRGNRESLGLFRERIALYWGRFLRRRSQKGKVSAIRLGRLFTRWLPRPRPRGEILRGDSAVRGDLHP